MVRFTGVPMGPPPSGLLHPGSPEDFLDLAVVLLQHLVDVAWRARGQGPRMVDLVAFRSVALWSNDKTVSFSWYKTSEQLAAPHTNRAS